MKVYNICDEKDHRFLKSTLKGLRIPDIKYLFETYYFAYVNINFMNHYLDGPSRIHKRDKKLIFYINGIYFDESKYWNHPDVIAYQYLKTHPELKAFV